MAIIRKFTVGVQPFAKMFRIQGRAGEAIDEVLRLRTKVIPENYFNEVKTGEGNSVYLLTGEDAVNQLQITSEGIQFTKDFYNSAKSFDFKKFLDEFRVLWQALNNVLKISEIRRIGLVAEYRYSVDAKHPSNWLRENLTTLDGKLIADKFLLQYEEREPAANGNLPDAKTGDFINYIYTFYDSAKDISHPSTGTVDANLDVQRYFAPLFSGNIGDEALKLHKNFCAAQDKLQNRMKQFGAKYAEK